MTGSQATVFMHVMKCGGTSVRAGLTMGIAGYREGPGIFELDGQVAARAAGGNNKDNFRFRDALLPYVVLTMQPKIVLGHFRYRDRYRELIPEANLVTVLRDPVDRFVSLWQYRRFKAGVNEPVSLSFEEFVASPRWKKEGHIYVETFCGRDGLDPRSDEAIAASVANLRQFEVVGRTERLDDFAREVGETAGCTVTIPLRNTGPVAKSKSSDSSGVDDDVLAQVREICAPDVGVYEQIFAGRKANPRRDKV